MKSLKAGKTPGVDNVPAQLLKSGGKAKYSKYSQNTLLEDRGRNEMAKVMDAVTGNTTTKERPNQTMLKL